MASSMFWVGYFQAKEGHEIFEIVAENVLNVHPTHPKQNLYYTSLFYFHQCSLLPNTFLCNHCLPNHEDVITSVSRSFFLSCQHLDSHGTFMQIADLILWG